MTIDVAPARSSRQAHLARQHRRSLPGGRHATLDLIDHARSCLAEAATATSANERFAAAHLAALRAAAAVLAARAEPAGTRGGRRRRQGPRNVWELLPAVAPELIEWSAFYAAKAQKRAAAQAGLRGAVTTREADDLLRDAEAFLAVVCTLLGVPHQEPLSGAVARLGSS